MKTALVIDDKYSLVEYFEALLKRQGMKVFTAEDSQAALRTLEQNNVDIVIADPRTNGKNGVEMLSRIKGVKPGVKVLVCTVFLNDMVEGKLRSLGADAVLRKPFPIPEFKAAVKGLLNGCK